MRQAAHRARAESFPSKRARCVARRSAIAGFAYQRAPTTSPCSLRKPTENIPPVSELSSRRVISTTYNEVTKPARDDLRKFLASNRGVTRVADVHLFATIIEELLNNMSGERESGKGRTCPKAQRDLDLR